MMTLDQAAKVAWIETGQIKRHSGDLIKGSSREFESVRNAVLFVMETIAPNSRHTAMILTDGATLYPAEIEAIYAKIKET